MPSYTRNTHQRIALKSRNEQPAVPAIFAVYKEAFVARTALSRLRVNETFAAE
jgi:hypothetical protein